VAIVTQIWEAQQSAFEQLVPAPVRASMSGGLHGEHEVVLHRPIQPDEDLVTWVEGLGSRRAGRHNLVTMRYLTYDRTDGLVAEQLWTTVLLDALGDPAGEAPPRHVFPEEARSRPCGRYRVTADRDMPRRYAEVSNDWSAHHFTVEAAEQSGFDRPFLHGLCTMALCAQGIVALIAGGDTERVRRIAVRFSSPLFVGEDLEVNVHQSADDAYAFEADSAGTPVIRNGLAEVAPTSTG
jgi:acyl dehydratase